MRKLCAFVAVLCVGLLSGAVAVAAEPPAVAVGEASRVAIAIAAGLAVALAVIGAALGQGRVGAAAMESIGRNPNAADRIFLPLVLALALLEALGLYGFVIAILLQGRI